MPKKKVYGTVVTQNKITDDIFDLWIRSDLAKDADPGQFVGVYPRNGATLLPRPLSICEIGESKEDIRLVYRLAGSGTREFAAFRPGESVALLGVLGKGFPLTETGGKRVFLLGGGIGIPPLLALAKALAGQTAATDIFLGYRDSQLFLADEMKAYGTVHIATEDGGAGTRGNVMKALEISGLKPDIIMACGPLPLLRAVKDHAARQKIKAYLSLEERMACGVGVCLGCVCQTTGKDSHSQVHNARICTEGPVFLADEVEI